MPAIDIKDWPEQIRQRYENYLKTQFFFKEPGLRASFEEALKEQESLLKGPFPEPHRGFEKGMQACALATECFPDKAENLLPALIDGQLYKHQERAIRATHIDKLNVVVATGTASGKTESFLYPILFELYRQHLTGQLEKPGVRAMILYPMNALANDQRDRLGKICEDLSNAGSEFNPTFGQYIGQTPENEKDFRRNASSREENRLIGERVFRNEIRDSPPHILLTNYSMLEYLLIRPDDSPLFDDGRGTHWQFLVLDEAHQYRGAKGMEMGMLIRRLKQRLRIGGRQESFRCIATSATITSGKGHGDRIAVSNFANELFGEPFEEPSIIFGESLEDSEQKLPQRYHAFLRALEGAFIVHSDGKDQVVLNRKMESESGKTGVSLEIALCRECGQHYYVGVEQNGRLHEAFRDPSHSQFGVDYYLPTDDGQELLCRICGSLSKIALSCNCNATIKVKKCDSNVEKPDQLKKCVVCDYSGGGGIGDPVQEIVHGSDGPNTVIATAIHELLPADQRKILAFVDSRQEAAFFAWYSEDSYKKLRDRNLILRCVNSELVAEEGLSIDDLKNRLLRVLEDVEFFSETDTQENRSRKVQTMILSEAMTSQKRLSLEGVGLVKWFVALPSNLMGLEFMQQAPWNFTPSQVQDLIGYLLDTMRSQRAMNLPRGAGTPPWTELLLWPQQAFCLGPPSRRSNVRQWGASSSAIVGHFLRRLIDKRSVSEDKKQSLTSKLMNDIWFAFLNYNGEESLLQRAKENGTFRLNPNRLRVKLADKYEIWQCNICAAVSNFNIEGICPRSNCPGDLLPASYVNLEQNHYRQLYVNPNLPAKLRAEEHTAQIETEQARDRQDKFKLGSIHLLSSSTTFEVGVDLGDLDCVFLRNVPPESFSYAQRAGRSGRRDRPGLVLTYCRRNPHDLYHYEDPEKRVIHGVILPPSLRMTNKKIILRHMVAVALSDFFRLNSNTFKNVKAFVGDWRKPQAAKNLFNFCKNNDELKNSLCHIVPNDMHVEVGLEEDSWMEYIAGPESFLERAEAEICSDYTKMEEVYKEKIDQGSLKDAVRIGNRMKTIADERTLQFLSRKAVIPKYGFPVDVVELDVQSSDVTLQRDLSQAIAEYAAGGKVVANKLEWESHGIKRVLGKAWPERHYQYDDARNFTRSEEGEVKASNRWKKYLIPQFGFVTSLFKTPSEPKGRTQRLYTTRPFFPGFDVQPESKIIAGVQVTKVSPGVLVILCEGRNKEGFYICRYCGTHMVQPKASHKTISNSNCEGTLERFSLGHELTTDVMRIQFPMVNDEWVAYSIAYAVLLGAANTLAVPDNDLNVTITRGNRSNETAIVLYDNVPGGAALVAQLEQEEVFVEVLRAASIRVQGNCGCGSSCYGCLRSYRNQFAHAKLNRIKALDILSSLVKT